MEESNRIIENALFNKEDFKTKIKRVYFTDLNDNINSAIAKLCSHDGFIVHGYFKHLTDDKRKEFNKYNIGVYTEHLSDRVKKSDLVIKSTGFPDNSEEIITAKEEGIPIISEYDILGRIMQIFKRSVGIIGAVGKSSVMAMILHVLFENKESPSYISGADIFDNDTNFVLNSKNYFLFEAMDNNYDILKTTPDVALLLNMDYDHTDVHDSVESKKETYRKFANIPYEKNGENGLVIYNLDDENLSSIEYNCKSITFGIENQNATYRAKDIVNKDGYYRFAIYNENDENLGTVKLEVPGKYNVYNALAAFSVCIEHGLSCDVICSSLSNFAGIRRRFEYFKRSANGASIYIDYSHHPKEIASVIKTLREMTKGYITIVFEPTSYKRLNDLYSEFVSSLALADTVILLDIHSQFESETYGLSSEDMANKMKKTFYAPSYEGAAAIAKSFAFSGDVIVVMGDGDVFMVADMMAEI